ncbi:chloride channel protein [Streptococcus sp. DD12]|uniref:chloride channel protein n=1 Tax=Streptococcus sp. DD12 TaxID=1777880 RepID=UPI000835760D|nr:chloride channel protein [Streptococcus sp. DD12]
MVGALDALFGRVLIGLSNFRTAHSFYLLPFLALAGLTIVGCYQKFGGKSGKGMTLVFDVNEGKEETIPLRLIPLAMGATWLTHLFGGSAGREGVAVQLGATLSHRFSRWISQEEGSNKLLVLGMAAGFAGLFQTPLAATLFAMEVLIIGRFYSQALFPTFVASFMASWTSHSLGLEKFTFPVSVSLTLTPELVLKLLLLGILFGLCGNFFAYALTYAKRWAAKLFPNPYWRIASLGVLLSILFLVLDAGRYSGLGTNLISASFSGGSILPYDWLLKLLLTVLTLAAGYQGGEVTPLFTIGACLGVAVSSLVGLPLVFVAALGYAAVFGSATSTFLGPMLIGCEVFGYANLPYFFIVCAIAFALHPQHSIYGAQKMVSNK